MIVDVVAGPAVEFPIAPGTFSVPEAAAFTLVWACSVAAIAWALGMLTIRHDQRLAIGSVNFLFVLVWFLLLSPPIWRWLTDHPGGSLRDVLGSGTGRVAVHRDRARGYLICVRSTIGCPREPVPVGSRAESDRHKG